MPARVRSESKSADLPVCAAAAAAAARAGRGGAQASQSTVREREHSACGQSVVGLFCNPPKEGMTANILAGGSPASTEIQNSILWILFIFLFFCPRYVTVLIAHTAPTRQAERAGRVIAVLGPFHTR